MAPAPAYRSAFSTPFIQLLEPVWPAAASAPAPRDRGPRALVFIHGAPQSHLMWEEYLESPLCADRQVYLVAMPSLDTQATPTPGFLDMAGGSFHREFDQVLEHVFATHAHVALVCHDFGANFAWRFLRLHEDQPRILNAVDWFVALSVGSSFRYDASELGLYAPSWMYSSVLALSYHAPVLGVPLADKLLRFAGYRGPRISPKNMWYYSFAGPFSLVRFFPCDVLGVTYLLSWLGLVDQGGPEFLSFSFPVLFAASWRDERMAFTRKFVQAIESRPNCRFIPVTQGGHFFPSSRSAWLIPQLVEFASKL